LLHIDPGNKLGGHKEGKHFFFIRFFAIPRLLSSNEEQASELGQIRLPGVFGGPGADIKLLILSHISGKSAI